MLATAAKLVACLAVVSTMECEGSAQATDRHEGNNLRAPPPTVPEMPTLQSANTTLLNTDEARMFDFPHGIPPTRMKHPPRASRLSVSPHTDQAKLEDLRRTSLLEKVDPVIPISAKGEPNHALEDEDEDMMEKIWQYTRQGDSPDIVTQKIIGHDELSSDEVHDIITAVDTVQKEYIIELREAMVKWWQEDKSLVEARRLYRGNGVKSSFYLEYQKKYYAHQARLGFEYAKWFREETDPAHVLAELEKMFPGQGKMTRKYCSEYKTLHDQFPEVTKKLKKCLADDITLASTRKSLKALQKKFKLSDDMVTLLELTYTSWIYERDIEQWKKAKPIKTPDEVYALLDLREYENPTLKKSQKYQSFLIYRDWWMDTHPMKMLMQQGTTPEEVFVLMKLNSVPDHELSVHPMYPHYLKYRKEWIVTYPERALESWKRRHMDPDDVFALLDSLEEPDSSKMRPYYENFADWLAAEQIEKRLMEDLP